MRREIGTMPHESEPREKVGYKSVIDMGREASVPFPHNLCDYPTKILPQVMGEFVERLSAPGELVLDPFAGGGTVAVECALRQRRSVNIDINPYALEVAQKKLAVLRTGSLFESPRVEAQLCLRADARALPIRADSVDAIVTDIPYADMIRYSDLCATVHDGLRNSNRLLRTQPCILLSKRVSVLRASLRLVQRCQVLQRLQVRAENLPLAFRVIQPQPAPRQVERIGDLAVVAEHLQRLLVVPLRLDRFTQRAVVARQREVREAIRRLHDFRNRADAPVGAVLDLDDSSSRVSRTTVCRLSTLMRRLSSRR